MSNIAKNDKKLKIFGTHQIRLLAGWEVHVYEHLWVCVCVCSMSVWESSTPPSCSTNSPSRRRGSGKSGFLSLLWAEFEGAQICACKMNGVFVYVLSPPKTMSSYSAKPRNLSLFPTLRKKTMTSTSHKQPMLSDMHITTCTLTHIPKKLT